MRKLLFVSLSVIIAGCGGGSAGSGSASNPVPEPEGAIGDFTFRAAATNPPVTTNSEDVTASGIKGNFSLLRLRDRLTSLDETKIYFEGAILSRDWEIYSINADGTNLKQLTNDGMENTRPDVSAKGDKIVFQSARDAVSYKLYTVFTDGTNIQQITNVVANDTFPAWSPDGNKIVFTTSRYGGGEKLAIVDVNTKVVTQLTFGDGSDRSPDWSPDGKTIVYSSTASNGWFNLYTVPAAGGAANPLHTPVAENQHGPTFSPDGTQILYAAQDNLYRVPSNGFGTPTLVGAGIAPFSSGGSYTGWSPDGKEIIANPYLDGTDTLARYTQAGVLMGQLLPKGGAGGGVGHPSWGPLVVDRTIVTTTGGMFGSRASGLLFTQGGPAGTSTRSVLTFDATTPSSVVLTQQTGLNNTGPTLVFSIDADVVTYLTYANANDWTPVRLIGTGQLPSANGAFVSFSSATGYLALVVPFNGSRGAADKPKVTQENGSTVFRGSFPAVLDATGKNLAPGGASEVLLTGSGAVNITAP